MQTGTICDGSTVGFIATPTKCGTTTPAYQWYNGSNVISGATNSYYSYKPTVGNTDSINVMVSGANNACQTASTASSTSITPVITAKVTPVVSITANPGNTVSSGTTVPFTATATNAGTGATYQWFKGGTAISGATGLSYSYTPTNKDAISFKVTGISNACQTANNATSNTITMNVITSKARVVSENYVRAESTVVGIQANLYPNPSHGSATLKLQGVSANTIVTVRGIYGNISLAKSSRLFVDVRAKRIHNCR